jgi:hypothetical protein
MTKSVIIIGAGMAGLTDRRLPRACRAEGGRVRAAHPARRLHLVLCARGVHLPRRADIHHLQRRCLPDSQGTGAGRQAQIPARRSPDELGRTRCSPAERPQVRDDSANTSRPKAGIAALLPLGRNRRERVPPTGRERDDVRAGHPAKNAEPA